MVFGHITRKNAMSTQMQLSCPLTDAEVRQRMERIVAVLNEIDVVTDEKYRANAVFKDHLKKLELELGELGCEALTKTTVRPVEVRQESSVAEGLVRIIRQDTLETVQVRPMTTEERQGQLLSNEPAVSDVLNVTAAATALHRRARASGGGE